MACPVCGEEMQHGVFEPGNTRVQICDCGDNGSYSAIYYVEAESWYITPQQPEAEAPGTGKE
jgi:hypothetical protein